MSQTKIDQFLKEVISYIKFPFVRYDIEEELRDHILDKIDYYKDQGCDEDKAEELSIRDMGDSKTIGRELNKQHNPFLGWFLKITNGFIIFCAVIVALHLGANILVGLFSRSLLKEVPKDNIVYRLNIDEQVKIDDRIIHFTNLIYDKAGGMNIFYRDYETGLTGNGWSLGTIGEVSDDLGTEYMGYSSSSRNGKTLLTIRDFSEEADTLIIDYDIYNRRYKVEIPLKEGDRDE